MHTRRRPRPSWRSIPTSWTWRRRTASSRRSRSSRSTAWPCTLLSSSAHPGRCTRQHDPAPGARRAAPRRKWARPICRSACSPRWPCSRTSSARSRPCRGGRRDPALRGDLMPRRSASPAPPGGGDEIGALYQGPLTEFIDARNRLAARLRQAGDADESARVKALPKPSAPAWALNQVYWHARQDYDRLIAAGDGLRALQQQMLGGRSVDPRDSMQERQAAVRQVVDRAARFLADAGQPVTDATRQRLSVTADALATWGSQPQGYEPGRLDRDIDPPGFAALAALGPPALRLVKSGREAAEVAANVAAAPRPAHAGARPAAKARPGNSGTAEPSAAERAAAKRAAEKAAQEAARAREAEHR